MVKESRSIASSDPLAYVEPPGAIFLDWYIAVSAFLSRLVASVASCGNRLTPIEADVKNSTPPRSNGSSRASCALAATDSATSAAASVPGS